MEGSCFAVEATSFLFATGAFVDNEFAAFRFFVARRGEERRTRGNGSNCVASGEPKETVPGTNSSSLWSMSSSFSSSLFL